MKRNPGFISNFSGRDTGRHDNSPPFLANSGMTLVEMMATVFLMPIVLGGVLQLYLVGIDTYESGNAYTTSETLLQIKLDQIMDELAETAETNMTIYSWVDPMLGIESQNALCFSSARDAAGVFITQNGRPDWQSLVVFAPYSQSNRGQIRRYESFGNYTFPVNINNITATQIILSNGLVFERASGVIILGNVAALDAQAMNISMQNPISVSIKLKVFLPKGVIKEVALQSFIDCRNANEGGAGGLYDE